MNFTGIKRECKRKSSKTDNFYYIFPETVKNNVYTKNTCYELKITKT